MLIKNRLQLNSIISLLFVYIGITISILTCYQTRKISNSLNELTNFRTLLSKFELNIYAHFDKKKPLSIKQFDQQTAQFSTFLETPVLLSKKKYYSLIY